MGILFWRGRVSKADFRREFIANVRKRLPHLTCTEVDEDGELSVRISGLPNESIFTHRLHNAYTEFRKNPREKVAILERWAGHLAALLEPPQLDRARILPFLKSRDFQIDVPPSGPPEPGSPQELFHDLVNDDLVAYYVNSSGQNFHFLTRGEVAELGLTDAEARALAQQNLRARTPERTFVKFPTGWGVNVGGNFEATLLVDEVIWNDPRFEAQEWILAAAPDRNTLLASVDSSVRGVWTLAFMAASLHKSESYPISPKLFVRREGRFEHLDPATEDLSHPIPRLDAIDVVQTASRGPDRVTVHSIVIASPLGGDPRSVYRLFRKLELSLAELGCEDSPAKRAVRAELRPRIHLRIHPDSHPGVLDLTDYFVEYVDGLGGQLEIRIKGLA
jgi:hypothetical protein